MRQTNNNNGSAAVAEPKTKPSKKGSAPSSATAETSNRFGENLAGESTSSFKRYKLTLVGVTALLMDPMNEETLNALRTGAKMQIDKTRTLEKICETKLYLDEEDELTMPATNLLAALNYVGGFFDYPGTRKKLATGDTSLIPSFMTIEGEFLKFTHDGWKPDQRRGRLDSGVAVAIVRPKFKSWSVEVTIKLDDSEPIKIDTVLALFKKAGKASGLGSFRPSCKGEFGKFEVTECVQIPLGA